jgi:hypothetical protein
MKIPGSERTLAAHLPAEFLTVPYRSERFPGAPGVTGVADGANCQLYAYAVLAHFGRYVPPLRSSELWTDERLQTVAGDARELDLILYSERPDPYGAHVGVIVGDDAVLHLCAEIGRPVVWTERQFAERDRYRVRIGIRRSLPRPASLARAG